MKYPRSSRLHGLWLGLLLVVCPGSVHAGAGPSELLNKVPGNASLLVLLYPGSFLFVQEQFKQMPKMKEELGSELLKRLGVDLTRVDSALFYAQLLKGGPEAGALLLTLPETARIKGQAKGAYKGVPLVEIEGGFLAASLGRVLVLGNRAGVQGVIDRHKGRGPGLTPRSPLHALSEKAARTDLVFAAGVSLPAIDDKDIQELVKKFGLEAATLVLDDKNLLSAEVSGNVLSLGLALAMVEAMRPMLLAQLQEEKRKAQAGDDLSAALGTIALYHSAEKLFAEISPRIEGGRLVSRYQVPSCNSLTGVLGLGGPMAAVAIPSFIKYVRRSKAAEAVHTLQRIRMLLVNHQENRSSSGGPSLGTTPWTPTRSCCSKDSDTCTPKPEVWKHPTWTALGFDIVDAHHYQYRVVVTPRGQEATIAIEARGDLDCDGVFSLHRLSGAILSDGTMSTDSEIYKENELE